MSHFAKVVDGIVTEVIVAEQDFIDGLDDANSWVQTSYNTRGGKHYNADDMVEDNGTPLRKNYAGIGDIYDSERDAFMKQQPYPSWILDEETCFWNSPIPEPKLTEEQLDSHYYYKWDEASYQADNTQGWVLSDGSE